MKQQTDLFTDYIESECKKHNVEYKRVNAPFVELSDNIKCSGFFSDGTDGQFDHPILCFADQREDWLEVLTHEYCHMTQWLEGDAFPLWNLGESFDSWLGGEDLPNVYQSINYARDLELDNEKRVVAMMKKWNLPVDIDLYTKKANAYVQFYNYLKESRKWSIPGNAAYQNQRVLDAMSTEFDMDYETLTDEIRTIFKEENI